MMTRMPDSWPSYTTRVPMVIPQILRLARHAIVPAMLVVLSGAPAHAESWMLFGTQETPFEDITPFQKWTGMLARHEVQRTEQEHLCADPSRQAACVLTGWMERLEMLRDEPRLEQIRQINTALNAMPYIEDIVNWGMADYWETPIEFLQRSGDCEDYSIAKYKSLRLLGVPADRMRIVVLNDMNLQVLHAVLAVDVEGTIYLLDNQIKELVDSRRVYHYAPIYSINEHGWWRHQPRMM